MILLPTLGVLATFGKPRASGDDPRLEHISMRMRS